MIEIKPEIVTLSNGLRFVYLHTTSPVAHLGITFLAGSRYENDDEIGLAHFLEHCIFKGTTNRKPLQILSRLDNVGGELNAYTTKEEICIYTSFVNNHMTRAADLLADIVINSNFPEKEIEKEKEIILDELNSYMDNPSEKIFDDFEALLFPNHPLGNNILGTPESVQSFNRSHLLDYVERFFFAENAVVSYVGAASLKKVTALLEKKFAMLPVGKKVVKPKPFQEQLVLSKRLNESNYQAHAVIGGISPGFGDESRRVMTLLINILGGPALNSRLNLSVREKHGYSYTIEAHYAPFPDLGYWSIYFGSDQKHVDKTLRVVYKEIEKLKTIPLTEKQLKIAKEQLKGHIALSLDSNVGLMQGLAKSLLLFNQIDSIEEIYDGIDNITSAAVQEVAITYFDTPKITSLIFDVK